MSTEKTLIRDGYAEHLGKYIIRAYLPAKTKAGTSSEPVANDDENRKSWQVIYKTPSLKEHETKMCHLLSSGKYELEGDYGPA